MCGWIIAWGDVPTWIGAVGTLGAVFWAVFLYANSIRDRKRAQARLLAPVGGAVPVQVLPGDRVEYEGTAEGGLIGIGPDRKLVVLSEAYVATVRLVSTSDETFSDIRADLLLQDGREVEFALSFSEIAPYEEKKVTNYYRPGTISGGMKVRIRFQDANGRLWERVNGEPVREIHHRRRGWWRANSVNRDEDGIWKKVGSFAAGRDSTKGDGEP